MDSELRRRFPDMQPINGPPTLLTVNGVGTRLNGRRDFDPETGTYVATQTFCFLFIPFLALGAYRVADAPNGGWYFIGKVPLSTFAKRWNLVVLFGNVVFGIVFAVWIALDPAPKPRNAADRVPADVKSVPGRR